MRKKCFIFDLDGVIVDTAKFHFLAWKNLATAIGINFTENDNEQLKGLSRVVSLEKILNLGNQKVDPNTFQKLLQQKNEEYLGYVNAMTPNNILPGVKVILDYLKAENYFIALGSASKNTEIILQKTNITSYFDTIVDGNSVSRAKPNPEVFLKAAQQCNCTPQECVVFEDSIAGIKAANTANMISIGIGDENILNEADFVFTSFLEIDSSFITNLNRIQKE